MLSRDDHRSIDDRKPDEHDGLGGTLINNDGSQNSTSSLPGYFGSKETSPDLTEGGSDSPLLEEDRPKIPISASLLAFFDDGIQKLHLSDDSGNFQTSNYQLNAFSSAEFHKDDLPENADSTNNWSGAQGQATSNVNTTVQERPLANNSEQESKLDGEHGQEDQEQEGDRRQEDDHEQEDDRKQEDDRGNGSHWHELENFTNTLFQDDELVTDQGEFESNWSELQDLSVSDVDMEVQESEMDDDCDTESNRHGLDKFMNTVFEDHELVDNGGFEGNWDELQTHDTSHGGAELQERISDDGREAESKQQELDKFTNTVWQDDELVDNGGFEGNWEKPRIPDLDDDREIEDDSDEFQADDMDIQDNFTDESDGFKSNRDKSLSQGYSQGYVFDGDSEDEVGSNWDESLSQADSEGYVFDSDSEDEVEGNWDDPQYFEPSDMSDDFEGNWGEDTPFTNTIFRPEDLNDDLDDFGPNYPESGEDIHHASRSTQNHTSQSVSPRGTHPLADTNREEEAFLQSLLDAPKNSTVTKEDLALFAKLLSDHQNRSLQAQNAQAQQIQALQDQGVQQAPTASSSGQKKAKSNKKVSQNPKELRLKRLVRDAAFEMMGRVETENNELVPITSATPEDVENFKKDPTNRALGPRANPLILDFNLGNGSRSLWNKKAAKVFAQAFIQTNDQYSIAEASKAFKTHIFHLKNTYNEYRKFVAYSAKKGNQAGAATYRDHEANQYNSRISRRRRILERRLDGCERYLTHSSIKRAHKLWLSMPLEAISGDETDHRRGQACYTITTLPWRAPWVHRWMLVFDRLHLSKRFTDDGRATRGAFPHIRISSERPRVDRECTAAPVGLPRNFYCPEWLSKQTPEMIESLEMKEAIDPSFSPEIIRIALTCANVISHTTFPIPLSEIPQNVNLGMVENGWGREDLDEEMGESEPTE